MRWRRSFRRWHAVLTLYCYRIGVSCVMGIEWRKMRVRILSRLKKKMTTDELQQAYLTAGAMLYGVALGYVGCCEEAEDVVQDAFVAVWRNREKLASLPAGDAPRYFVQVVKHTCIDHLRRLNVRPVAGDADGTGGSQMPDEAPTPYEQLARKTEVDLLHRLAEELPDKQAQAFSLFHFEGLELSEVAERMGETEAYVRVMLSRARKSVKEKYLHCQS